MSTYKNIIKELQERRQYLNLSSQEVAEKIGVSDSLVSLWECYKKQPSTTNFLNWIQVLGYNLILNVNLTQMPKDFEPNLSTRHWITNEFGERFDYTNELKIYINHYRASGTTKSDWQYAFRSWLLRAKKFQSNSIKTTEDTQQRRQRIHDVFSSETERKKVR